MFPEYLMIQLVKHCIYCASRWNTYTCTDAIETPPWGFAVNTSDDKAIAAKSAIIHDDSNADVLLIRANIECILS